MASRSRRSAPKPKPTPGARRQPGAATDATARSRWPADAIIPDDAARSAFVRGLLARGEAAAPGPGGRLPPGATHEIIGTAASGLPVVKRRRYA